MRPLALFILAACAACRAPSGGEPPAPSSSASAAPATTSTDCDGGLGYGASCDGKGSGLGVPGKAHDPSALRVEASLVGATAGLPGEVVIRVVRANLPRLRRCHAEARADGGASPKGQVRVAFEIDAAGKPVKVRDAESTLGSAATRCMARVIEGLSFPTPERAPAAATIEVKISPP